MKANYIFYTFPGLIYNPCADSFTALAERKSANCLKFLTLCGYHHRENRSWHLETPPPHFVLSQTAQNALVGAPVS